MNANGNTSNIYTIKLLPLSNNTYVQRGASTFTTMRMPTFIEVDAASHFLYSLSDIGQTMLARASLKLVFDMEGVSLSVSCAANDSSIDTKANSVNTTAITPKAMPRMGSNNLSIATSEGVS